MMVCICDCCSRQEPCYFNGRDYTKPLEWWCRTPDGQPTQHACSATCRDNLDRKDSE